MSELFNSKGQATRAETDSGVSRSIQGDELLTVAEVAAYLKLSRRTAWRWCKSGRLRAVKVGHQWRVARSNLDNFIYRRGKLVI